MPSIHRQLSSIFGLSTCSILISLASAQNPSTIVLGWDDWTTTQAQEAAYQIGATGTATAVGLGVKVSSTGGRQDGTFGTTKTNKISATGKSYIGQSNNRAYYIDFNIQSTGARTELRTFHFDAFAGLDNSHKGWTLSVVSGDITHGTIARGELPLSGKWHDQDIDLSVLNDHDLGEGGSATLRLTWWGGKVTADPMAHTRVDNVAIRASVPLEQEAEPLAQGERADWLRGAWGAFWGPGDTQNGASENLKIDPFIEQMKEFKTLDYIQLKLTDSFFWSPVHNAPHPILESLWEGDVDADGKPVNLVVPRKEIGYDPFFRNLKSIKAAGLKTQVYVNLTQLLEAHRRTWRMPIPEEIADVNARWKQYCDKTPVIASFMNSRPYHNIDEELYPERKYYFAYAEFVLKDFALRYGDLIDAWILDSGKVFSQYNGDITYTGLLEDQQLYKAYTNAVRAGNPNVAISFNQGQNNPFTAGVGQNPFPAPTLYGDYTFGHPFHAGNELGDIELGHHDNNYSFITWMRDNDGYVYKNGGFGIGGYEVSEQEFTSDDKVVGHVYYPMATEAWNGGTVAALSDEDFLLWNAEALGNGGSITWGMPLLRPNVLEGAPNSEYTTHEWAMKQLRLMDDKMVELQYGDYPGWTRGETLLPAAVTGRAYYHVLREGEHFFAPEGEKITKISAITVAASPSWLNIEEIEPGVWVLSGIPDDSADKTYNFNLRVRAGVKFTNREVSIKVSKGNNDFVDTKNGLPVWPTGGIALEDATLEQDNVYRFVQGVHFHDFEGQSIDLILRASPSWISLHKLADGIYELRGTPTKEFIGTNVVNLRLRDEDNNQADLTIPIDVSPAEVQRAVVFAKANHNYGEGESAIMISDLITAPDGIATYRLAFDITANNGHEIRTGDRSGADTTIGLGENRSFDGTSDDGVTVSNPRIIEFQSNGGHLYEEDVSTVFFYAARVANAASLNDSVRIEADGSFYELGKLFDNPERIIFNSLGNTQNHPDQFIIKTGNSNDKATNKWTLDFVQVEVRF